MSSKTAHNFTADFEKYVKIVPTLKDVSQEHQLRFYSLYKQATEGNNTTPRPGMLDMKGKAKWDAWKEVTDSGKTKDECRAAYVILARELNGEERAERAACFTGGTENNQFLFGKNTQKDEYEKLKAAEKAAKSGA